jgi:hypothetical protein
MAEINEPTIAPADVIRPTVLEVDLAQLETNYRTIRNHVGVEAMASCRRRPTGARDHALARADQGEDRLEGDRERDGSAAHARGNHGGQAAGMDPRWQEHSFHP